MNYTSLLSIVPDYLARSDLSDRVPDFIEFAQQRINRRLRIRPMEKSYIRALDADGRVPIPSDFLQIKNFFVFKYSEALPADGTSSLNLETAKVTQLEKLEVDAEENVHERWTKDRYTTSRKRFTISRQGNEWLVRPTNTDLPNVGGLYYARLPLLGVTNETNWLTDNAPDLLVRGACYDGAIFIKDPEQIAYWKGMFDEALVEVASEFVVSEHAGSHLSPRLGGP